MTCIPKKHISRNSSKFEIHHFLNKFIVISVLIHLYIKFSIAFFLFSLRLRKNLRILDGICHSKSRLNTGYHTPFLPVPKLNTSRNSSKNCLSKRSRNQHHSLSMPPNHLSIVINLKNWIDSKRGLDSGL